MERQRTSLVLRDRLKTIEAKIGSLIDLNLDEVRQYVRDKNNDKIIRYARVYKSMSGHKYTPLAKCNNL